MTATARRLMRALVAEVLGDRADRVVVTPVLLAMIRTEIADFERFYDRRQAAHRVRDFDILQARNKAAKAKP